MHHSILHHRNGALFHLLPMAFVQQVLVFLRMKGPARIRPGGAFGMLRRVGARPVLADADASGWITRVDPVGPGPKIAQLAVVPAEVFVE